MSYFLCLAVPREAASALRSAFDERVYLTDATNLPIGKTTMGANRSWTATLLCVGAGSGSLIGRGAIKKTHNNDHTGLFLSGAQALLAREDCPSLSFLAHWMRGYITTEEISIIEEKRIAASDLPQTISELKEDARYTVVAESRKQEGVGFAGS